MDIYQYTYDLVKQIPAGKISTYGAVARALGDVRASRAVGRMMNQNPDPDCMPCFKIVQSDGMIGGFGRGIEDKIKRLNDDGIDVKHNKIIDFDQVFFNDFQTTYPLKSCRKEQQELSKKVDLTDSISEKNIDLVAGFDVAYSYDDDWKESCGACVILDVKTNKIVEHQVVFKKTRFPYIPTYLSFREKPFIEEVFEQLNHRPNVVFVDGNGILHPRQFGLACHIGVILDMPTLGVAKNLLCGRQQPDNSIMYKNKKLGHSFYANKRVKKPVYISPGHKISLNTCIRLVKKLSSYKQPEPLRQAHLHATKSFRKYHQNHY